MTTYRLMDGASGRPGVGSSGTQPPAAGTPFAGAYIAGNVFSVSQGGLWLQGYWWYVAASGQDTSGWKFALWQLAKSTAGQQGVVSGSVVTGGTLTAGQFNFVALSTPLLLTPGIPYCAAVGKTVITGFPDTTHQFGASNPYAAGVTNGPLFMPVASNAVMTDVIMPQSPFTTAGADPAVTMPATNNLDDILWLDVQVTDQAPAGATYRAWPSTIVPYPRIVTTNDQTGYTLALQFSLSQACMLQKIWHYSARAADGTGAATVLPTRCAIWNVGSQTVVPGTDNTSPAWHDPGGAAAAAGDGWVYCDYSGSGVTLAAATNYKVATFHAAGANWFGAVPNVFAAGQFFPSGFTSGPLTIPGDAASSPGQQSWNTVSWAYPATSTNPEADWIDVEVLPAAAGQSGVFAADQMTNSGGDLYAATWQRYPIRRAGT